MATLSTTNIFILKRKIYIGLIIIGFLLFSIGAYFYIGEGLILDYGAKSEILDSNADWFYNFAITNITIGLTLIILGIVANLRRLFNRN